MDVKSHRFLEKSKARFHLLLRIVPGGNGCQGLLSGFFSGDCLGGFVFINVGQPQNSIVNPNLGPCLKSL